MSERAKHLARLRELERRDAEIDAMASDDLRIARDLLDPLMHSDVRRVDVDAALAILTTTKGRIAELNALAKQIHALKAELGVA